MFTELILDKLGVFYDDIVKKKHGSCPEITYGLLIERIITNPKTSAHTLFPEIGEQTFNRTIKRAFSGIKLNGGQQTWCYYLLSLIEHKYCYKCNNILPFTNFAKNSSATTGIDNDCKSCVNATQAGQYKKYISAHQNSYAKNKGKIRARGAIAKYNRSLRKVAWANHEKIAEYYKNCPPGYEVDHEFPLLGKYVSGLHVDNNLKYLTCEENRKKGNKYSP